MVVIVWTIAKVFTIGDIKVAWPGLNKAVFITLYHTPYAAHLGLPAARHRHGHPRGGNHHGVTGAPVAG